MAELRDMLDVIPDRVAGSGATQPVSTDVSTDVSTETADTGQSRLASIPSMLANPRALPALPAYYGSAADRYAAVSREQWEQYKQYGYPIENQLIGMIGNKNKVATDMAAASGLAKTAGNVASSEAKRGLSGYGLHQTQAQATTNARLNNLDTTANMAISRDTVRNAALDRDRQILIGGAPGDGLPNV